MELEIYLILKKLIIYFFILKYIIYEYIKQSNKVFKKNRNSNKKNITLI